MINQKLSSTLSPALIFLFAWSLISIASADAIKSQPLQKAAVPDGEAEPKTKFLRLSPQETGINFVQPIDITIPKSKSM